jgi:phosphoglycerate dehydrogenase-like enzyme
MQIYKLTNTLDGYLPAMKFTKNKEEAEIILVGGKNIDLAQFPKLVGIFKTGVGTDNLPYEEAKKRFIEIELPSSKTMEIIIEETASFTCYLILRILYISVGDWNEWKKFDRPALFEQKLLVVGNGRIGKRVVKKMSSFMKVDTFDSAENAIDSFQTKVRSSDVIALLVPLTDETHGFFDAAKLAWMKDGAALVNTSRGPVIDESALFQELCSGRLRAAIDVFWTEPYTGILNDLPDDRFIRTPHVASSSKDFVSSTASDFVTFVNNLISKKQRSYD